MTLSHLSGTTMLFATEQRGTESLLDADVSVNEGDWRQTAMVYNVPIWNNLINSPLLTSVKPVFLSTAAPRPDRQYCNQVVQRYVTSAPLQQV